MPCLMAHQREKQGADITFCTWPLAFFLGFQSREGWKWRMPLSHPAEVQVTALSLQSQTSQSCAIACSQCGCCPREAVRFELGFKDDC